MSVILDGQELTLTGTVGAYWFEDGFTHAEIVTALAGLEGDITVRLNSGGGIAAEGAAIYSTLVTYDGDVNLIIEGIAASAASLIAMAGDTITMADGAVLMIHDPMNITIGNSADHAKTIEELEAYAKAYARVYAKRSGKTADECRDIMKAETWFDSEAAIEAGFADDTGEDRPAKAKASAFDYRVYAHAPKRFSAMARAKNWSMSDHLPQNPQAASSAAVSGKDTPMTDKERADALAAEVATLKAEKAAATASADAAVVADRDRRTAIMKLDETKGREALAEHLFMLGNTPEQAKATLAVSPAAVVAPTDPAAAYEAARLAGASLNAPVVAPGKADNYGWSKVVAMVGTH